jgi:hypothetical protein
MDKSTAQPLEALCALPRKSRPRLRKPESDAKKQQPKWLILHGFLGILFAQVPKLMG